jgi:hypothetical protein
MIEWNRRLVIGCLFAVATSTTALACRDKGPKLTVFYPKESSHFVRGDTVHFAAEVNSDVDPGLIGRDGWRWVSNVDGEIGKGPRLYLPNLSVGEHRITASVRHKLGSSSDSVTIFIDSVRTKK